MIFHIAAHLRCRLLLPIFRRAIATCVSHQIGQVQHYHVRSRFNFHSYIALFLDRTHLPADRDCQLAHTRSVGPRVKSIVRCISRLFTARSAILAQSAGKRSVASVAQNRLPYRPLCAFPRHPVCLRRPGAVGQPAQQHFWVRRRLGASSACIPTCCVWSALIGRVLRLADRCFLAVEQVHLPSFLTKPAASQPA